MLRYLLFISLVVAGTARAHNPLVATFTFSQQNGVWMIDIALAQTGAHEALKKKYPEKDLDNLLQDDHVAYKQLMIAYIKETCSIKANNKFTKLGAGGIQLGDHETSIRLMVENMPANLESMTLNISSFQENEGQQNVIAIIQRGHKRKFIADASNNFTIQLKPDKEGRLASTSQKIDN